MRDPHKAWRAWRTWGRVIGALYRLWRCPPCPRLPAWVLLCQGLALLHLPSDHPPKVPVALTLLSSALGHSNSDASANTETWASVSDEGLWLTVTLKWRGRRAGHSVGPCFQIMRMWARGWNLLILPGAICHLNHWVSLRVIILISFSKALHSKHLTAAWLGGNSAYYLQQLSSFTHSMSISWHTCRATLWQFTGVRSDSERAINTITKEGALKCEELLLLWFFLQIGQ